MLNSYRVKVVSVLLALLLHAGVLGINWEPDLSGAAATVAVKKPLQIALVQKADESGLQQAVPAELSPAEPAQPEIVTRPEPIPEQERKSEDNPAQKVSESSEAIVTQSESKVVKHEKITSEDRLPSTPIEPVKSPPVLEIADQDVVKTDKARIRKEDTEQPLQDKNPTTGTDDTNQAAIQASMDIKTDSQPLAAGSNQSDQDISYRQLLRSRIEQHKRYPRMARLRHREGKVKLRLQIEGDGQASVLEMIEGDSLFEYSSLQAVREALPLPPPDGVMIPVRVDLTLYYHL
ncbi:energy transducer TonB [Spongorhabdus nitratireducens]